MSNIFASRSLNIIEDFSINERRYFFRKVDELKKAILAGDEEANRISRALTEACHAGTLACRGAIRHVPVGMEAAPDNCWEGNFCNYPLNIYQHGAYWSTPTGWVARAIAQTEPETAARLIHELVCDLQKHDFRNTPDQIGAPYECFHDATDHRQNPVYLTSVTAVLAALRDLS